jgi:hypothetical protein
VTAAAPLARIPVGVVVERRKAASHWIDFTWQAVAVLPGQPAAAPWTMLATEDDRTTFYAGPAEVALYRTEAAHYRDNLASAVPSLWVALRPTGVQPAYEIVAVTADPAEGESFTQVGDDLVEAVAMPSAVRELVEAFVAEHYVERVFMKRERDRADPQALARHPPKRRDVTE